MNSFSITRFVEDVVIEAFKNIIHMEMIPAIKISDFHIKFANLSIDTISSSLI